jgi:hypothetical protein
MFTEKAFDSALFEESPVELPLRILVALPQYITDDPAAPVFNLPGAIGRLLGRAGAERATRVLMPRVWAPGFTAQQLRRFATSPFLDRPGIFEPIDIEAWRVPDFPSIGFVGVPSAFPVAVYDVVQFAGRVEMSAGEPQLLIGVGPGGCRSGPGALRDALVAARTRLLILGVPGADFQSAVRLADFVAGGGGPAVVVVAGRDAGTVNLYLLNLYANIVHNQPLPQLAKPDMHLERPWLTVGELPATVHADALNIHVAYAKGGEGRLNFSNFKKTLEDRVARLHLAVVSAKLKLDQFKAAHDDVKSHLLPVRNLQIDQLSRVANDALKEVSNLTTDSGAKLAQIGWDHESEGVIPLSESAEAVSAAETTARVFEVLRPDQIKAEASVQTRILNANVADPSGRILDSNERLSAGKKYELLVDVGPLWDRVLSIVRGSPKFGSKSPPPFPEAALPVALGWTIDVVFISDQCRPPISSARLWLPPGSGRSVPYLDSLPSGRRDAQSSSDYPERALQPGPVALPVLVETLPASSPAESAMIAGRLCLYYENNLLQSAMVKLGLEGGRTDQPRTPNLIEVDFTLSGTLGRLDSLSGRTLNFEPGSTPKRHPIAMAVTLNDDGGSGHRVIVRMKPDEIVGFAPIDPLALRATVGDARTQLSSCFYLRNEATGAIVTDAAGVGRYAFSKTTNGKSKRQFAWDLMLLAEYGRSLFLKAFGQVITRSGTSAAEWMRDLRRKLVDGQVIQITRTNSVPAQYAFPWAMIYDYDLPGPQNEYRFCDIMGKWTDEGIRNGSADRGCPEQKSHGDNTLCPYGFWGLKHIIEQPASVITDSSNASDATSQITIHNSLDLAVGLTRDQQLDARALEGHVKKLSAIPGLRLAPPSPADNSASLQAMLRTPQLLYFLCHVEGNPQSDETFLSIGPHDGLPDHRISVYTLNGWITKAGAPIIDLAWWRARRPLVFINGCRSANLTPGQMVSFVTAFTGAGASGVIGTEVNVTLPIAIEFAERVFERINQPAAPGAAQRVPIGEAIRQVRWDLANKGNLLGLAYTPYCLADLQLVADGL